MTNLFSSFDPVSMLGMQLNWLSTFIGLTLMPFMYWVIPSRQTMMWNQIINTLHKEFNTLMGPNAAPGSTLTFIALFSLIVFNNSFGLIPHIFTSTSHLTMTLTLALPLWLGFMLFGWINHTQHMFAHLVPQGTPPALMMFMVCIETISNTIRPGTLAVRLAANMTAGHLTMTLLGNLGPMVSMSILPIMIITQILLLMLESAVAVIQAYVFAVLSTLYSSEVI
uniref:ATP synthase subunit a n=1 Tax=Japyx solifugus TaxID=296598 RepID=Q4G301_JAPSO|nr:ATP synthase F0 subunit 6 [Japyx solifugus]AAV33408.1 ATP synthase F0 subunit 6 [Japyx solifugus]